MVHSQHRRGAVAPVPDHFGGALSKPLVMPETAGSQHIDYRISMYQPMAHVKLHRHKVQEQVYHVLQGEGLMEIDGETHVVRMYDYIFLPPGVDHAISNTGLVDLVFLIVTAPVIDDGETPARTGLLPSDFKAPVI
jgi:mannose-6-phosphate isomerase-like protein (cupin superfamily)